MLLRQLVFSDGTQFAMNRFCNMSARPKKPVDESVRSLLTKPNIPVDHSARPKKPVDKAQPEERFNESTNKQREATGVFRKYYLGEQGHCTRGCREETRTVKRKSNRTRKSMRRSGEAVRTGQTRRETARRPGATRRDTARHRQHLVAT